MFFAIVVTYLFVFGASAGEEQLKCEKCRGQACNDANIPFLECDPVNNKLPYNFEANPADIRSSIPTCVELEYSKGTTRIPVRQCMLLPSWEDLCTKVDLSLPASVKLVKCDVYRRKRREWDSDNPHDKTISANEESTTTSTELSTSSLSSLPTSTTPGEVTSTDSTTLSETTTEANANTALVSFSTLTLVIIIHALL